MKYMLTAVVSIVFGVVLGGIKPKNDLRKLEKTFLERPLATSSKNCSSTIGSDLAQLMGGSNPASPPPQKAKVNPLGDRDPQEIAEKHPEAVEIAENIERSQENFNEDLQHELKHASEELETARAALELRRAQARASLIEGADPDSDQLQRIDQAVQDMNDSLIALSGEFAEIIESGEEPSRRQIMSFTAEALDTMLAAEDTMRDTLSKEQQENIDDGALDPFSYVSPDLIDTLMRLDN